MTAATISTQLSLFNTIKTLIKADSTLGTKFKDNNIHQFEPKLKSVGKSDLPYIVIRLPSTSTDLLVLDHKSTWKDFVIEILMVNDYEARDKVLTYANALIAKIESSEQTFMDIGYHNLKIDFTGANEEVISSKDVITSTFDLTLSGLISR